MALPSPHCITAYPRRISAKMCINLLALYCVLTSLIYLEFPADIPIEFVKVDLNKKYVLWNADVPLF